jgi:bacterioferritin
LHKSIESRAFNEMKHAEILIDRILFLEGTPLVSNLNKIHIGADVEAQLRNDLASELTAAKMYNAAVLACMQARDNGSRELLEHILEDEEKHIDWLEAQLDQISQMGLQNYLVGQMS